MQQTFVSGDSLKPAALKRNSELKKWTIGDLLQMDALESEKLLLNQ
jgi:hypothetical protein